LKAIYEGADQDKQKQFEETLEKSETAARLMLYDPEFRPFIQGTKEPRHLGIGHQLYTM